ncbi:hypothetical protein [Bdellovibrio sp. HCB274]|uniref:hypothetical protein n=1 Tax=Bdellovibrio sp. HCB274 TaxID=3394361 RepID=UPI0039B3CAD8
MKHLKLIPVFVLACSVLSFSAAQAAITCSNSPNDYVTVDTNEEFVTIKTPKETRVLTVLGTDTNSHDVDNGVFGPQIMEKWHTYFVFEEDESIQLIFDDYVATNKFVAYIATTDGKNKVLHTYKTCTHTK